MLSFSPVMSALRKAFNSLSLSHTGGATFNPNITTPNGQNLLIKAVKHDWSLEDIESLIQSGCALDTVDRQGFNILHHIVKHKRLDVLRALPNISDKVLNHKESKLGFTPLHLSVESNQLNMTVELLERSAEVDSLTHSRQTPLHRACIKGHSKIAQVLCHVDANVDAQDLKGWTPLQLATYKNNQDCIEVLKAYQANRRIKHYGDKEAMDIAYDMIQKEANIRDCYQHDNQNNLEKSLQSPPTLFYLALRKWSETRRQAINPLEVPGEDHPLYFAQPSKRKV